MKAMQLISGALHWWAQVEEMNTTYLASGIGFEIQDHQNNHNYFDPTTPTATVNLATDTETGLATLRSHGIMASYLAYGGHRINKRGQELARDTHAAVV